MKTALYVIVLLGVLLSFNRFCIKKIDRAHKREREFSGIFMMAPFVEKVASLEYEGMRAFQLSLAVRVLIGEAIEKYKKVPQNFDTLLIKSSRVITALNPYYYEVYYYTAMLLMWELSRPELALKILMRATKYLPANPNIYLFIGFDYFYFLNDPVKGAYYLKLAAKYETHPGNKLLYYGVAARLMSEVGKTEVAIAMIDEYMRNAKEKEVKEYLYKRKIELMQILRIQRAVMKYEKKYGKKPSSLKELVAKGFLEKIPVSPLGREFYIDSNGRVKLRPKNINTYENGSES